VEQTIYREEMARVNAPPQVNVIGINLVGPTLIENRNGRTEKSIRAEYPQR